MPAHNRFLCRARRRWALWRGVEFAGIGAAVAAAAGLVVVPVLFLRSAPATMPAVTLLAIGAAAGLLAGLTRQPTLLQTAVEVDRQLQLNDLLSTAIEVARPDWHGDGNFRAMLVASADAICRQISPSELLLRRLGGRAWGGIGILAGLVVIFAMMSAQPPAIEAKSPPASFADHAAGDPSQQNISGAAHDQRAPTNLSVEAGETSADFDASRNPPQLEDASAGGRGISAAADGAGETAGRSNDAQLEPLHGASTAGRDENGQHEAGGGLAVRQGTSQAVDGVTDRANVASSVPPVAATVNGRGKAPGSLPAGRDLQPTPLDAVPAEYRAMVREFFDRTSAAEK